MMSAVAWLGAILCPNSNKAFDVSSSKTRQLALPDRECPVGSDAETIFSARWVFVVVT